MMIGEERREWSALPASQTETLTVLSERSAMAGPVGQLRIQRQLQQATTQFCTLVSSLGLQKQLTGVDPLTPEAQHFAAVHGDLTVDDFDSDMVPCDASASTNKMTMSPAAERLLQTVFALADTLDGSQLAGLAHLARCHEQQVCNDVQREIVSVLAG